MKVIEVQNEDSLPLQVIARAIEWLILNAKCIKMHIFSVTILSYKVQIVAYCGVKILNFLATMRKKIERH